MGDYAQGTVTVSSTPALLCTVGAENDGVVVSNTGSASVYLGGRTLTNSGATLGVLLAANATMTIPSVGGYAHSLYATTTTGSSTVAYLFPTT